MAAIEFLTFREYYGMPRGHSLSIIYARFSGKKRTSMYISREKGDHYYIQTRHDNPFSRGNLFLGKLKEKLTWKACVNTDASISDSAHAPWASHNTPYIQLIQYGRRIGKRVYSSYFQALMYRYQ